MEDVVVVDATIIKKKNMSAVEDMVMEMIMSVAVEMVMDADVNIKKR